MAIENYEFTMLKYQFLSSPFHFQFFQFFIGFFCFTDGGGTSVIHTPSHKAPSMVRHFFHTINLFSKCFIHFLLEFTECVVFV